MPETTAVTDEALKITSEWNMTPAAGQIWPPQENQPAPACSGSSLEVHQKLAVMCPQVKSCLFILRF